jgi:hypothetical protein
LDLIDSQLIYLPLEDLLGIMYLKFFCHGSLQQLSTDWMGELSCGEKFKEKGRKGQ